jgi:PHD/YefM family antitoxin component YafN of YafNO toxin-antitoxin module
MPICVPVRDMKDTATFTALVESERDVTVTKNGYEAMHCISSDQYRLMQEEIAKAKLLSRMMLAEDEVSQGDYSDYDSFATAMRDKYDL